MHRKHYLTISGILILFLLSSLISCRKDSSTAAPVVDPLAALNLPSSPLNYANQPLPGYYLSPNIAGQDNTPINNTVTDWGATLGRVLFYDKMLSIFFFLMPLIQIPFSRLPSLYLFCIFPHPLTLFPPFF